jgi:hypothetical protein
MRRLDRLRADASEIRPPLVVADDQQDVGRLRFGDREIIGVSNGD